MSHIFQITVAHDVTQIWRLAPSDHRNLLVTSHAVIIGCYKAVCAFSSYYNYYKKILPTILTKKWWENSHWLYGHLWSLNKLHTQQDVNYWWVLLRHWSHNNKAENKKLLHCVVMLSQSHMIKVYIVNNNLHYSFLTYAPNLSNRQLNCTEVSRRV